MSGTGGPSRKFTSSISLNNYHVMEKIGAGSYSTVYKGMEKSGGKQIVAIKCVEKVKLSTSGLENIITEIRVMKMLKFEHIIEMIEFQWDEKYIYMILEYCDGGDLSKFIKRRRKLSEDVLRKFMRQLALGLRFLRSHNICHLDLKPQNLLLKKEPTLTLKIADFGFAQFLSNDAQHTSIRGSPLYMAPEMLLKNEYDAKADLWSVGVIAYECLFGKPPFGLGSCKELVDAVKAQVPIQIPEGSVTAECRMLLCDLLVYDPTKRIEYSTFFEHSFIDLEHYPSEETYSKATHLIRNAILLDSNKEYEEAFSMYCDALLYLVPYVHSLPKGDKKQLHHQKVLDYTKRAEEIKSVFNPVNEIKSPKSSPSSTPLTKEDENLNFLKSLCTSTPSMASALEMGLLAQMYLAEGNYEMARTNFESSLGILVPLLSTEPHGKRRELLSKQIKKWLRQAESLKALLSIRLSSNKPVMSEPKDSCILQ